MELKVEQTFRRHSNPEISIDEIDGTKENLFRVHSHQPRRIGNNRNLINIPRDTIVENYNQSDNTPLISLPENIQSPDDKIKINDTFYWTVIYLGIIVSCCVVLSFPVILIPNHDQIKHPECWWESMYSVLLSFALSLVLSTFQDYKIIFKDKFKISSDACLRTFILVSVTFVIPFGIIYLIWTVGAGYNPPIPFVGIGGYCIYMSTITALWFQVPSYWRTQKSTQRKFQAYLFYYMWCGFTSIQYNTSSSMFAKLKKLDLEYLQWIIGIYILMLRELNSWVLDKLINKAVGFDDIAAKMTAIIYINCQHSFYVAIAIGDATTDETTYLLLIGDFALNIYNSYKIIKMHRIAINQVIPSEEKDKEKQETTLMLVTIESLEILVPIAYSVSFLIAYYGPNGEVLGNVYNDCWQYKKIENVGKYILLTFQMFFIDLGSAIVGGLLLWKYCAINMLSVGCTMIRNYWPMIALKFAHRMTMVRNFDLSYPIDVLFKSLYYITRTYLQIIGILFNILFYSIITRSM